MKITLNTTEVASLLLADEYAKWSYAGASALAEYIEKCEEDSSLEIEIDCTALRGEFSEYESLQEWAAEYCDVDQCFGASYKVAQIDGKTIRDYIKDTCEKQLIEFDGGIIVSNN